MLGGVAKRTQPARSNFVNRPNRIGSVHSAASKSPALSSAAPLPFPPPCSASPAKARLLSLPLWLDIVILPMLTKHSRR